MTDEEYLENETIRPCDGELGICPLKQKSDKLVELLNDIANSNELEYSWNVEIRDAIKKYRGNE